MAGWMKLLFLARYEKFRHFFSRYGGYPAGNSFRITPFLNRLKLELMDNKAVFLPSGIILFYEIHGYRLLPESAPSPPLGAAYTG